MCTFFPQPNHQHSSQHTKAALLTYYKPRKKAVEGEKRKRTERAKKRWSRLKLPYSLIHKIWESRKGALLFHLEKSSFFSGISSFYQAKNHSNGFHVFRILKVVLFCISPYNKFKCNHRSRDGCSLHHHLRIHRKFLFSNFAYNCVASHVNHLIKGFSTSMAQL